MTNLLEKTKFKLKSLGNKLIKPNLYTIIELETDKTNQERKFYGKSLTGNFLAWVYLNFHDNDSNFDFNDISWDGTGGTNRGTLLLDTGSYSAITANRVYEIKEGANDDTWGMLIGTGTTPQDVQDYDIETLIPTGTGAGEMTYGAQGSIQGMKVVSQTASFVLNRLFTNNSGSPIDVTELVIKGYGTGATWLIYRDVFSAVTVEDGETLNAKITFATTT
jgi:hypothetical protein